MIVLNVDSNVEAAMAKLKTELQSKDFFRAMAQGVAIQVRKHLAALDSERANALGGKRTHFYADAARQTSVQAQVGSSRVVIAKQGLLQRLMGGEIRPVTAKFLTIPADPEAYGKRAGEFDDLVFALLKGKPALVKAPQTRINIRKTKSGSKVNPKESEQGNRVMYWLRRSVNQDPDPTVLPDEESMSSSAAAAGESYLDSLPA